jgi:hypothetical protein
MLYGESQGRDGEKDGAVASQENIRTVEVGREAQFASQMAKLTMTGFLHAVPVPVLAGHR